MLAQGIAAPFALVEAPLALVRLLTRGPQGSSRTGAYLHPIPHKGLRILYRRNLLRNTPSGRAIAVAQTAWCSAWMRLPNCWLDHVLP